MKTIFLALVLFAGTASVQANPDNSDSQLRVTASGDIYKVSFEGEKGRTVRVAIFDQNGNRLLLDIFRNPGSFVRPYNFSALPEGDYTIELSDGKGKFVRHLHRGPKTSQHLAKLTRLNGEEKYLLSVRSTGNSVVRVSIYDEKGNSIYKSREKISGEFARVYSFKGLKGKPSFEITDGNGIVTSLEY